MSDVVVTLGMDAPEQEARFASAVEAFARWREETICGQAETEQHPDAPHIMVKTGWDISGQVEKKLIFQERKWAAAFLQFWRAEKRKPAGE